MKKKIIIITGNEIRHKYFRTIFGTSKNINLLKTYCEKSSISDVLVPYAYDESNIENLEDIHYKERFNTEHDFFSDVLKFLPDQSRSVFIEKGEINSEIRIQEIIDLKPDLIITYGCCIISSPLIKAFLGKIINVHLGISPYYFGSGTNFHPLVNNEPQFVGYTFMYIDEGIDTGEVIHQKRARINYFDNPHQIGNRLIKEMTSDFVKLVENFNLIKKLVPIDSIKGRTYKKKDATLQSINILYKNFSEGLCREYIKSRNRLTDEFPILEQDFMKDVL